MQQTVDPINHLTSSVEEKILAEKVRQAYDVAPRVFLPALALSLLLAVGVWSQSIHVWVITWIVALGSCYLVRAIDWRRYHSLPNDQCAVQKWSRHMHLAAGVTGIMWGLSILLPLGNDHQTSFFVGFVLAGVSAGAVPGLSCLPRAAMAFVIGCVLPFTLHSAFDGGLSSILMALMSVLFIAVMFVTIGITHDRVNHGIRNQLAIAERDSELTRIEELRKVANESLRRTKAQLESFIKHAPAAVAMFNCKCRYLAYSNRWLSDYGVSLSADEVLLGRSYFEVMPDLTGFMRDAFDQTLKGEIQSNDQYPYIRNDGHVKWFRWEMRPWYEDSGEMGGVVMYSEDITENKHINDALLARERLLDKLGAQIPGIMFQGRWRAKAGFRFTFISANAARLCGYEAKELIEHDRLYMRLFRAKERVRLYVAAAQAAARAGSIHLQLRLRDRQHNARWVQIDAIAERLADGSVLWYGYAEDISLRHQMAIELTKLNVEVDESGIRSSAA